MTTAELRKLAELIQWRLEQMDCNCDRDPELLCHRCKGLVEIQEIIDARPMPDPSASEAEVEIIEVSEGDLP